MPVGEAGVYNLRSIVGVGRRNETGWCDDGSVDKAEQLVRTEDGNHLCLLEEICVTGELDGDELPNVGLGDPTREHGTSRQRCARHGERARIADDGRRSGSNRAGVLTARGQQWCWQRLKERSTWSICADWILEESL